MLVVIQSGSVGALAQYVFIWIFMEKFNIFILMHKLCIPCMDDTVDKNM